MKILIVDDDKNCLEDMADSLKPTGYEIEKTTSPKEGLDWISKNHYDVVISDIKMPEIDGIEFLRLIGSIDFRVRVISISGYKDIKTIMKLVNLRGYDFYQKPVCIKEILECLRQIEKEIENDQDYKDVKIEANMLLKMRKELQNSLLKENKK